MKTLFSFVVIVLLLLAFADISAGQYRADDEFHAGHQKYDDPARTSPNRESEIDFGSGHAMVEWSAPSVRDRDLYGNLVPTKEVWRTGANEATVIHFDDDVLIEGEELAAGSYALFTIGGSDEWTFIFDRTIKQWGAFSYNPETDALRVTVASGEGQHAEELSLTFADAENGTTKLRLRWGTIDTGVGIALAN